MPNNECKVANVPMFCWRWRWRWIVVGLDSGGKVPEVRGILVITVDNVVIRQCRRGQD